MGDQPGRNDLCPCGSGKKMKVCHPNGYAGPSKNRNVMLIGIGVAVVAIAAVAIMSQDSTQPLQAGPARPMNAPATTPVRNAATPATQGAGTPQPGPAPPGKVWSPEHGHWHDDPAAGGAGAANANNGIQISPGQNQQLQIPSPQGANQARPNTPQPPGPAPEGKVWDVAHGHWHDAPKTGTAATPAQSTDPK